ncbi:MAG: hypothetical protein WKF84_08295 [Pyrinomonadaceae bacterium]
MSFEKCRIVLMSNYRTRSIIVYEWIYFDRTSGDFPWGQVPATDSRNVNIPHTDTHFTMPVYKTRAEWEARVRRMRTQILSAAGLLPMPEKSPLNPRIFGRIENKDYSVEKVYIETLPGYYLGGNLYRPLEQGR